MKDTAALGAAAGPRVWGTNLIDTRCMNEWVVVVVYSHVDEVEQSWYRSRYVLDDPCGDD
jgi:hypothetical protein